MSEERQRELELTYLNDELERRVDERAAELALEGALSDAVLSQLPAGLIIVSPSGKLLRANDQASITLGRPIGNLDGVDDHAQTTGYRPDGRPYAPHEWPVARSILHGEVVTGEQIEIDRPDGTRAVIEVLSAPIRNDDGRIAAGVAVFFDVSTRERRDRVARDFVVNAAHELRTPLAGITAALEVLESGAKEVAADRDRFLQHVRRETARLTRLTSALLTLARAESGTEHAPAEIVPLAQLIGQVAAEAVTAAGVRLVVDCTPDLAVLANTALTAQALSTLVENAAHHTKRGSITLTAVEVDGGRVAIAVSDTGSGIPPHARGRVFERFFRGDVDGAGLGLGLSIAQRAVAAQGGEVTVDPRPGGGTVARITLPGARIMPGA